MPRLSAASRGAPPESSPAARSARRRRPARFSGRGLAAVCLLLLVGALAAARPAYAQSACPTPDFGDRRNIWTATLTVGAGLLASYHGFYAVVPPTVGSLSPATFTIGTTPYTIDTLLVETSSSVPGQLEFGLASTLPLALRDILRLHVCGTSYDLRGSTLTSFGNYTWNAGLNWSSESSRTVYLSLPSRPASGRPSVRGVPSGGVPTVGLPLTADTSGISDADGTEGATFEYQWQRWDGDRWVDITGATEKSYVPVAADFGKSVRVVVDMVDALGNENAGLTSSSTAQVAAQSQSCDAIPHGLNSEAATHLWHGKMQVKQSGSKYGYSTSSPAFGRLQKILSIPRIFPWNGRSHLLSSQYYLNSVIVQNGALTIAVQSRVLAPQDRERLTFWVCGRPFKLSDATENASDYSYTWSDTGLDWRQVRQILDDNRMAGRYVYRGLYMTIGKPPAPWDGQGVVQGNKLILIFHEALDLDSVPAASAFTTQVRTGSAPTVSDVAIDGRTVVLTLSAAVTNAANKSIKATYTRPDDNPLQDRDGNKVYSYTNSWIWVPTVSVLPAPSRQQAFVSNYAQLGVAFTFPTSSTNTGLAQRFTTGNYEVDLRAVRMRMSAQTGTEPRVSIYSDSSGAPGTSLLGLSNPGSISRSNAQGLNFSGNLRLEPRTRYWVVLERASGSGVMSVALTTSTAEDGGRQPNWTIGDLVRTRNSGTWGGVVGYDQPRRKPSDPGQSSRGDGPEPACADGRDRDARRRRREGALAVAGRTQ